MAEQSPKRFVVSPEDIINGQAELSKSDPLLISDDRIRDLLASFAPTLHQGIEESDSFRHKGAGYTIHDSRPLEADEFELWNGFFGMEERVQKEVQAGTLFVPDIDATNLLALQEQYQASDKSESRSTALRNKNNSSFRVNMDPPIHTPITPFNQEDMQFVIKPQVHLGSSGGKGNLYNALISFRTYAKDKFGRFAVAHIPGTGVASWDSPVFGVHNIMGMSLWFNTQVKPNEPNSLTREGHWNKEVMFKSNIHKPEELQDLQIPQIPELKLFFWQLNKLASGKGRKAGLIG